MRISLNWIKEFIDLPKEVTPEKLAHDLTMATVEVEEIIDQGQDFDKMVVGKVVELKDHPNADRLKLVMTDVGDGKVVQIVCGGNNLFEGMLVCVALPGAKVRWHGQGDLVELSPVSIRGEKSFGMICAAEEVGLSSILPGAEGEIMNISFTNSQPGAKIAKVFALDDVIFDIDNKSLTNRPDLWGHYGLAREIAAIYKLQLKPLQTDKVEVDLKDKIKVKIKSDACYRYLGTVIDNVKIGPSPAWLRKRLQTVGQKSINNIVDLTNYVMFELGQPTHAFAFSKLQGGQIVARLANQDEPIKTLDEEEIKLDSDILVIADTKKPVALAGVIGGLDSAISADTTKIVLEAATFNPVSVRTASQRFEVRTESSMRFEKGLDTERAELAMRRMLQLLQKILPEAKIGPTTDECKRPTPDVNVKVDIDFINSRLGRELTEETISNILTSLQFKVKVKGSVLSVTVPSWRSTGDISLPEDIVEEVARMYGYDNLEFYPPEVKLTKSVYQPELLVERKIKEFLSFACAMNEVYNYPWVSQRLANILGQSYQGGVSLINPPAEDNKFLRNSLIPNLIKNIEDNVKNFEQFKIFELGRVFLPTRGAAFDGQDSKDLLQQPKRLAGAVVVSSDSDAFLQVKGIWQALIKNFNLAKVKFIIPSEQPLIYDKVRRLAISIDEAVVGYMGELKHDIYSKFDFNDKEVCLFEVDVAKVIAAASFKTIFKPLPQYPIVIRDMAVVLKEGIKWADIKKTVLKASKLVKEIKLFDIYTGSKVPVGNKSVAFTVTLSADHTLETVEINKEMDNILKAIDKELGGKLRDF